MSAHPDLTFRTLDPHDDTGRNAELLTGWGQALHRGFHEGRMDDERRRLWLEHCRTDDALLRGAWPDETTVADGTVPVATFASFDGTINVGGARTLPLHMITDVTVSPSHRRRGLLRTMMTENLAHAAERGLPLAALTVSEGSIYGRFGFGVAVTGRQVEVDTTSRFGLRPFSDDGRLEMVEPAEIWATLSVLFAEHHGTTRGSVSRPQFYEPILTGAYDWEGGGPDKKLRAVVHLDTDGRPDGTCVYKHVGEKDGRSTVEVADLVATSPTTYLRLWRFLADIDLTERVRFHRAPVDDPLLWAVIDPRAVRTTGVGDQLWVRVLDIAAALEARQWGEDGASVLEIDDAQGHVAGRWRVTTRGGTAEVSRTESAPDVRLDADTLGALYLGGIDVPTLAAAGRLHGSPEALAIWSSLTDVGPTPHCITGF